MQLASNKGLTARNDNPLFWSLRNAFVRGDTNGLDRELRYSFQSFLLRNKFSKSVTASHKKLADLRYPYDWFPATRAMQRTIHLHVGPTNSGKTYHALKALENAETGIYAGPLRLLAHEVFARFTAKGKPCALITGEEQRIPEGTDRYFASCTVEMAPLNKRVDVAVIDEIQMIADQERGWAWTQAVLGLQARELHLCGEERAVDIIKAMCARMGDKCIVHTYKRLNPLRTMQESLQGDFRKLEKGDCVVSFTRIGLHTLKAGIEKITGRRCAVVYGSLPPETRAQQAALFNDPNNDYDFIVASDAIGMGLNLEIKRVIFEAVTKYDGGGHRVLTVPEVRQIGGRAGRYRTAAQDIKDNHTDTTSRPTSKNAPAGMPASAGLVTTLDDEDLGVVQAAFTSEAEPIKAAGILPPTFIIEQFYSYFSEDTPLSFVLARMREMAKLSEEFQMCSIVPLMEVADLIQEFPMSIQDRLIFLTAPANFHGTGQKQVLKVLARCISENRTAHLLDIEGLDLDILDIERGAADVNNTQYLQRLEELHKSITLYLWLSYRYQGVLTSQHLAFHVKSLVEEKIKDFLDNLSFTVEGRKAKRQQTRLLVERHRKLEEKILGDEPSNEAELVQEGPGAWSEEGHEEALMEDEAEAEDPVGLPDAIREVVSDDRLPRPAGEDVRT
ncbi:hypothetical protein VTK73DRAFT_3505 [Phialemonium thermophilum]|uniref:RNA helicase n=1 Tax=Phialemonium thermophilum TaxID=223376 RepID=A0ABR3WZ68_9PEZI